MTPQFVDIHAHVNFSAFKDDRDEAVKRALEAGVWMINVGTQKDTSQGAVELSEKYESGVYAAIGLHPIHTGKSFHDQKELGEGGKEFTSRGEVFDLDYYRGIAVHPKVVAIGECGLDYYGYPLTPEIKKRQVEQLLRQIELANELRKPLMLHIRNGTGRSAYRDAFEIIRRHTRVPGNLHFFAGSIEEARPFLNLGFSFSFTGVITFVRSYDEVVRYLPLNHVMSETDCPYVAPRPYRGTRNEPRYVLEVVQAIASIRGEPFDRVAECVRDNAFRFFNLTV